MWPRRIALIAAVAAAALAAPAGSALAAMVVDVESAPAGGADKLVLRALGADTNVVYVRYQAPSYVVTAEASALLAGPGCLVTDLNVVTCLGDIGAVTVRGGDAADIVDLTGVPVAVDADGGNGGDALTGGLGVNTLKGGAGPDQLTGGPDSDQIDGGPGDDWIIGRGGADSLFGDAGDDIVQAGTGAKALLSGGSGRDLIKGGAGYDLLQGNAGDDVLAGGDGPDSIAPGTGADAVVGLTPADSLNCPAQIGSDGTLVTPPCVHVDAGGPPQVWPPAGPRTVAAAGHDDVALATPVVAGNAIGVQVHIPAKRWKWVRRCLRTYSDRDRQVALAPFPVRFRSKFYPTVEDPRLNPRARSARITPRKGCHV